MSDINNKHFSYSLDKRRGYKYTCPSCHGKKCFRRYVENATGRELAEDVGVCDHINSCRYQKSPREYFAEHPELKKDWRDNHPVPVNWAQCSKPADSPKTTEPVKEFTLDSTYVEAYQNPNSNFVIWLVNSVARFYGISIDKVKEVFLDYNLGADNIRRVVFWQRDSEGRVRTGKMMQYSADGHREGNPNWIHCYLMNQKKLDSNTWELRQCLFGEHLLSKYPDKEVGLVESEKTAIICSLFYPEKVWVASGGCHNLSVEKLQVLVGRRVTVYPDSGVLAKWYGKLIRVEGLMFTMDTSCEDKPANTDIADILLSDLYAAH